jgi:peptide deformylase
MILRITKYGEPILRQKGARIQKMTPEIEALIADMFETMESANGIGLAAQQVGHALQLAVIDVRPAAPDRPSTLFLDDQPADPAVLMPLVLINPVVTPVAKAVAGPEGCLSFPEIFADIERPESVQVVALNAKMERIQFRCGGLLARAVQHEGDHLQGILFIDRMPAAKKAELREEIDQLHAETRLAMKKQTKAKA